MDAIRYESSAGVTPTPADSSALPVRHWSAGLTRTGARATTVALAAVALVRAAGWTRWPWLIAVSALAPLLLTLAWPLALLELARRRLVVGAVLVLLGVAQLAWLLPDYATGGRRPIPAGSVTVSLITANLLTDNRHTQELAASLRTSGADVVVLQEFSPANEIACERSGLLDAYPFHVLDPLPGVHGSAILSRHPLRAGRVVYLDGWPMTQADVVTAAGLLRVVNVHVIAPLSAVQIRRWTAQLAQLRAIAAPAGGHLVLAGDFNATLQQRPLRLLVSGGLRDAFLVAGSGYGATYPTWLPTGPVLRLDHVLVSPGIAPISVERRSDAGSDHLGVAALLALPPVGVAT